MTASLPAMLARAEAGAASEQAGWGSRMLSLLHWAVARSPATSGTEADNDELERNAVELLQEARDGIIRALAISNRVMELIDGGVSGETAKGLLRSDATNLDCWNAFGSRMASLFELARKQGYSFASAVAVPSLLASFPKLDAELKRVRDLLAALERPWTPSDPDRLAAGVAAARAGEGLSGADATAYMLNRRKK